MKSKKKERRRGRGREKEEKKRRRESKIKKKVWILVRFGMDSMIFGMETNLEYGIVWITWISCIDTCLWVVGCRKSNPRMSSCMEIITNPFVFLGFCYEKT